MPTTETKYHITIIHAEDDYDIPWSHSGPFFRHSVSATRPESVGSGGFEREK
jgi:abhydrolase domain-containing protein 12